MFARNFAKDITLLTGAPQRGIAACASLPLFLYLSSAVSYFDNKEQLPCE
jgi:hypothetical protein